jgi:alpha-glucosidase
VVSTPPAELRLDPFYKKYVDAGGLPVVSSEQARDDALVAAAKIVVAMLAQRPDLQKELTRGHVRIAVMAVSEVTTDIPEHSRLTPKDYWDKRARGLGGTPRIPTTSCAEENLLGLPADPYVGESILIHEFAHTIHGIGMKALDAKGAETFDERLKKLYEQAKSRRLWEKTYAATNAAEYWAEGVQSYFDSNQRAEPADGVHNAVRTREELAEYDPELGKLVAEVFGENPWRWTAAGAHAEKWKQGMRNPE